MNLWIPDTGEAEFVWRIDAEHSGRAQDLSDVPSSAPIAVIMPGQWGRIYSLDLPKLRGAERLAAAGFAIEDKVAAPMDEQHLVLAADGQRVGVISKSKMQMLMQALGETGFDISGVYLDYDVALPGPAVKTRGRVIVPHSLTGGVDGYTVDSEFYAGADRLSPAALFDQAVSIDGAINFASGRFASRSRGAIPPARFARAAALIAVLGASWLVWQFAAARSASGQAEYLNAQSKAMFTQITGKPSPANPALAVTRALKSGATQDADFLGLSAILFSALETVPGAQIDTLDYDAARPQIRVRILYPDLQTATQMERAVSALGATLSTGNLRERGGDMMGDAVLTRARAS